MTNYAKRFIIVIILILVSSMIYVVSVILSQTPSMVKSGELDLSKIEMNDDRFLSLSGEWSFYWNQLIKPNEIRSHPGSLIQIPSVWNDFKIEGETIGGDGYATYSLKVSGAKEGVKYGLRIENLSTSYKCFIDGIEVASNGIVGKSETTSKPNYYPVTINFVPENENFDIVFHVSNYTYARGGFWYDAYIGSFSAIEKLDETILFKDAIVIGSLIMMAVYFASHFMLIRRAEYGIFFVIMSLLLIIRTSLYGDYLIVKMFPDIPFEVIVFLTYLIIIWFPVTLVFMIQSFTGHSISKRMSWMLVTYGLIMTAITLMAPIKIYTQMVYFLEVFSFGAVVYAILRTLKPYVTGENDSFVPILGAWMILLAGLHDVFYQANLISNSYGEWSSASLVIFMYLLTFMMNKRYSQAYTESIIYSNQLKQSLEDQKVLTEELIRLDGLKDQFLTNTSHELRTPLNGIINIIDSLLRGHGGNLSSNQFSSLSIVKRSGERLYHLINDILDAAMIKENKLKINISVFDVFIVIEDCFTVLKASAHKKDIQLINGILPHHFYLESDEERFKQIMLNIMGNAIKYTEFGEVRIEAKVEDEYFTIKVIDTGVGISEENLKSIYQVFHRLEDASSLSIEGNGLGLFIAEQLATYLGAKIAAESEIGRGSTFTISFSTKQLIKDYKERIQDIKLVNEPEYYHDEKKWSTGIESDVLALVVDDQEANRKALVNHLNLMGISCDEAKNGVEALSMIHSERQYSIVLLDIMMPGLSGFEVLKRIRENYDALELPVLMLTARINPTDVAHSLELGANDYLSKPYDVDELNARVNNILGFKETHHKLLKMELSFLQAQIKPHFIFNALSVISSLSVRDPLKSKVLILDLADYLRLSFDFENHSGLSNLDRELDLVKAYASIQRARFGNLIQIDFEVEPDIDLTLPVLCIQPLVENAIIHGSLKNENGGHVLLSIKWINQYVRISICDNGPGISLEVINRLLFDEPQFGHVGLQNIHNRLKKLYGNGLNFHKSDSFNTVISFDVPYVSKESIHESISG